MRSVALALAVAVVLMLGGCEAYESTTAGGVVSGSSEQMEPLESTVGAPMSVASG